MKDSLLSFSVVKYVLAQYRKLHDFELMVGSLINFSITFLFCVIWKKDKGLASFYYFPLLLRNECLMSFCLFQLQ